MARETREIIIGASTLVVLALVLGFVFGGREVAATDARIHAVFNRVDGLAERDDVYLAGIRIGHVGAMRLDDNYRAVVTLAIDPTVKLPVDSTASIQTDGLFGSKFVVLTPGSDEKSMKSGHRIIFTEDAVVVGDLLELIISEGRANEARSKEKAGG